MTPTRVSFPRTEPVVDDDGLLERTDTWTQEGEVVGVRPDDRIEVVWDDPHWGPTRVVFAPDEVESVQ